MKRRSSTSVKKILHSGHTFSTRDSFPPGVLPTKRHVIERILHLKNFRTFNAANDIVREIYDRWVWCNVLYIPFICTPFRKKLKVLLIVSVHLIAGQRKNEEKHFYKRKKSLCELLMKYLMIFVLTISSAEFWRNNMV